MPRRLHQLIRLGAAIAIVVIGLLLLRSLHRARRHEPLAAVPVMTALVASGDVPIELEALGQVRALNTVTIRPRVAGQVMEIEFKDGQDVKQGDVLVQIDPRPLQATVAQDKATLARDRANQESAETDLRRYVPLLAQGIVSAQQVSDQRALVARLSASVAASQAALERDQVELSYTTITAPISGVLGLTLIDVGNMVDAGSPSAMVVLTQIQPISIHFPVPEAKLYEIQERQAASRTGLVVQAWSQDGNRQLDQGTLTAFSNEVDINTGTVMAKANFPNPHRLLWPGALVAVRLVLGVQHNGLTVPAAAVSLGPNGPFAWTVAGDGTVTMAPLRIRQRLRGQVLVTSGLSAGQRVVTDGQYGLTPGVHVAVQEPAAPTSSKAEGAPVLRTTQPGQLGISP